MTLEPGMERNEEFTAEGATCTVTAKLREVEDDRKLRFDVEVCDGERTIGLGTHERRVIDRSSFG